MNDMTGTTASEVELRRRLDALAATATVDDEAWESIQNRIADRRSRRRRPTPKQLIAVAAAIVVIGAIVLTQRYDHQRVETVDESTTTTSENTEDTTTTSVTTEDDPTRPETGPGSPGDSSVGGLPTDGSTPGNAGAPGGGVDGPGSSGEAAPTTGSTPAPTTTQPSGTMPDGHAPSVTFVASGYTLQATFWRRYADNVLMNLWRPDRGFLTDWSRDDRPGQDCLAGESEFEFDFPEPGSHAYSWGMVRSDAAEVRIVATSGEWTTAVIGSEAIPGLRPWIGKSPSGQVDRFEARDAAGNILHVAGRGAAFDAWPDSC